MLIRREVFQTETQLRRERISKGDSIVLDSSLIVVVIDVCVDSSVAGVVVDVVVGTVGGIVTNTIKLKLMQHHDVLPQKEISRLAGNRWRAKASAKRQQYIIWAKKNSELRQTIRS
uniref:Uncharacterized protein n=1 Tax=Glossina brevipalpis TaxID=37001 RepID=A0A1A9WDH0_9MUSC